MAKSSVSFAAWSIILNSIADACCFIFVPCATLKSGAAKLSISTIRIAGGVNNKYMTMNSCTISRIDGGFIIKYASISEEQYDLGNYFTCVLATTFTISI